jgi:hypothetical protein
LLVAGCTFLLLRLGGQIWTQYVRCVYRCWNMISFAMPGWLHFGPPDSKWKDGSD